jgi:L-iditol 2-dehydrogenase
MKKVVLTGIRRVALVDVPEPELTGDGDVLIRIGVVGICGSDVHYYNEGNIGSQVVAYPFAVGHECAGVVEAVGCRVTRVKPGDRIAVDPAISCWQCDQCKAGRSHTCRNLRFLGCPGQLEGCLCEKIVMPESSCYPIPDSLSLEEAVLSEPLAIGVYAVATSAAMNGARIGILGAGPIGLSVLLAAQRQGVTRAYVTDKINSRLQMADALGACWTGHVDAVDVVEEVLKAEPGALDVVFECCGEQDALDQAVKLLRPGGKLMLIGIPTVPRISFEIDLLRRKELCVQNVRRQNECVQDTLDALATRTIDVRPMVTHRYALEETDAALALVSAYADGVVKAMVQVAEVD